MPIDVIIVGLFLVITLAVGFYYGKGITTFQDYAVGNRKMSNFVITISLIATTYGGGILISRLDGYYRQGFHACIMDLASPVSLYLASRLVILRMKECIGHLSVAESMGSLYGPMVRMTTALFGIMMSIALLVPQFKVGLRIVTILCPEIEKFSTHSAVILALLVIGYSTFGGARAVAFTDVYQFFLFGICFPILIVALLYYAPNPLANWQKLMDIPTFNLGKICRWDKNLAALLTYFIWHAVFPFDPARIQRFYMASSVQQAAKVFNRSIIIRIIFTMLFLSVAVALHLGGHPIQPNQKVLDYIVQLTYAPGIRGILVTAIIALLMSTADSNLHAASVLCTNDLLPTLVGLNNQVHKPSLWSVRIASALIGIASLFVVFHTTNLTQLLSKSVHFYGPAVTVPLIMASFGFRPRSAAVLFTTGISTVISIYRIYYKAQAISQQNVFESLLFSALILVVTHYLLPKRPHTGWIGIKDRSPLELQNQETKRWWIRRLEQFKQPFAQKYWQNLFPKKETTFILLGIYLITNALIALCYIKKDYFFPYIYGYMAVMAMGTILALYPACHAYKQGGHPLLHWVWPGLLFLLLFISTIQFAKLAHFHPMVCAWLVSSLGLGMVLLSFKLSMVMLCIATIFHKFMPPHIPFWDLFWAHYCTMTHIELVLAVAIAFSALVGFTTYKWLSDQTQVTWNIIELARTYERRIALESIYNQVNWSRLDPTHGSKLLQEIVTMLQAPCNYLYKHGQEKLGAEINIFMKKLGEFSKLLLQRAKEERNLELDQKSVQSIEISSIVLKAHSAIHALREAMQLLLYNQTAVPTLLADPHLFEHFLTINLLEISKSNQATDHIVTLTIADTTLRYDYASTTQPGKFPPTLPALAFLFSTKTDAQSAASVYDVTNEITPIYLPKTVKQLYQAESRQIIRAHGGYVAITETKEVLTCLYVLPIAGQKVMRFKTYDAANLGNDIAETAESLAQEKELVALLTSKTTLTKEKIIKTISFIKNVHGLVTRKSGAPYYTHPMAVAKILLAVTKDPVTLLAGLLHDVVEDSPVTLNQIELMYGAEIAYIIDMVTHYNTNGYRWKFNDGEQKSRLDQCKDIRVVQVKLADRLHNIRTLHFRNPVNQKRIAKETMAFYIPWGKKNKLTKWVEEMEHICQEILNKDKTIL